MSQPKNDDVGNLLKNNEIILSEIKKGEGAKADVFSSTVHEIRVVYEVKDFSVSTSQANSMYGIRAISGGRMGFITTNSDGEKDLRQAAQEVQQICRLSTPNEHNQIADKPSHAGHFGSVDPKLSEFSPQSVCQYAETVVKEATHDSRVAIDRAEFSWTSSQWALSSSNGFSQTALSQVCSWYVMGMAKGGQEVTSFDYDGGSVNSFSDLEREISRTISNFRESVTYSLGAKKGKTYKGPVLLHPQAVMDLIGDFVESNCNGLRHQDGMSSWKGKLGELVASDQISVFEDPLNANRIEGWMPFDREGVPTARHNLIESGKLNFIAHNCFSAHREKTKPTGNAHGGARSLPAIGFSNLSIGGSQQNKNLSTEEALYKQLKNGLVLKRFSGNSDSASGQFSGVAKNSWWAENGTRSHPVTEVMVSGNLFELLKNIVAVGSNQVRLLGGGLAPYILVDGLSVTSA